MEAVGAAEDVFYEEEDEVNCYDFEPLPTLLEDEVSEAGAEMELLPLVRSPVMSRPQGQPAAPSPPLCGVSVPSILPAGGNPAAVAGETTGVRGFTRPAGSGQAASA